MTGVRDHVWDEVALARDLTVEPLDATAWRVSLTMTIPPDVHAALIRGGAKRRRMRRQAAARPTSSQRPFE